jgi:hypothetical protein
VNNYTDIYQGIVIQSNDPEKRGRVKVFCPAIHSVLLTWNRGIAEDIVQNFAGKNVASTLTDEDIKLLQIKLPFAEIVYPIMGGESAGFYNKPTDQSTVQYQPFGASSRTSEADAKLQSAGIKSIDNPKDIGTATTNPDGTIAAQNFLGENEGIDASSVAISPGLGGGTVKYGNANATRKGKLTPRLEGILNQAAKKTGLDVVIHSGGQPSSGTGRTGTHRHDNGFAGDIWLYKNGKQLGTGTNASADVIAFAQAAKDAGATGIGAGDGYMRGNSMHVDISRGNSVGDEAGTHWGRDNSSDNSPQWLRNIMGDVKPTNKNANVPTNDANCPKGSINQFFPNIGQARTNGFAFNNDGNTVRDVNLSSNRS